LLIGFLLFQNDFHFPFPIIFNEFSNAALTFLDKRDKFDVTPEQSKAIWDIYLEANPNPKISVEISPVYAPLFSE